MNRLNKLVLVFILILCMLFSFGCRNASINPTPTPTDSIATPIPTPVAGGELILAMPTNPKLGDPHIVNTEEMLMMYSLIFESLLSVDDTGKLAPSLAQSWTADTEDSSIWTLNLRQNVKWHSGNTFTATDVLYTYHRLLRALDMEIPDSSALSAKSGAVYAQLGAFPLTAETEEPEPTPEPPTEPPTEPPITQEPTDTPKPTETPAEPTPTPVVSPTPTKRPEATPTRRPSPTPKPSPTPAPSVADASYYAYNISKIANMSVIDDYTIRIKMQKGGLSSLYALTFPIMSAQEDGGTSMIGTGAYKVIEAKKSKVELTTNEMWWRTLPYISKITFLPRADNATAVASYEAKQLNFVTTSIISSGKYREEGVTKVLDMMTNNIELMIFNYDNPIFADLNVRKAITYALDTSRIVSNVYMNKLQDVDVPVAPDSWLYSSKYKVYEYDLDYAKGLLADAGYTKTGKDGILHHKDDFNKKLSFTLLVNETTDNAVRKNAAEAIKTQLLLCGIEVNVVSYGFLPSAPHSKSEYIQQLRSGNFDLALVGYSLNQDGYLEPLFTDSEINYGKVECETLLSLNRDVTSAVDEITMREAAYAFETAFIEELPFIVLGYRLNSIIYSANIHGILNVREPDIMESIDKWYIAE